jgi:hypothetical protein
MIYPSYSGGFIASITEVISREFLGGLAVFATNFMVQMRCSYFCEIAATHLNIVCLSKYYSGTPRLNKIVTV